MQSKARTVNEYLAALPPERREHVAQLRACIQRNLPAGYEEGMQYGMIGYYVPHRLWPAGYHCDPQQPLPFAGIAAQKNHLSIYLACVYAHEEHEGGSEHAELKRFKREWAKSGKKLDMGKACVRFKRPEDAALDVIGDLVARTPVALYLKHYQDSLERNARALAERRAQGVKRGGAAARKSAAKSTSAVSAPASSRARSASKPAAKAEPRKRRAARTASTSKLASKSAARPAAARTRSKATRAR
jgi:hypothetical protein